VLYINPQHSAAQLRDWILAVLLNSDSVKVCML
jgi:hypothetical protein